MAMDIILEKQDLTYLRWSHIRSSSGTAGTFLKSESVIQGKKIYYKLSNFDTEQGIIGHECVNEIIVDRLLTLLGVEHLHYQLIYGDVEIEGKIYTTYLCASPDFKEKGESKITLENYYAANRNDSGSRYDFCRQAGFQDYIDRMLAVDYIILNRDRHGANMEVLRNARNHTLRIAPLFDHGLSLMFSCHSDDEIQEYDVMKDRPCNNFIGGKSCLDNLALLGGRKVFTGRLSESDKAYIFEGLAGVISDQHIEKIWDMIWKRYQTYENI